MAAMLNIVAEYFSATAGVPLALSATSPTARRAVESVSRGFVVKDLRLHHEECRKDEEVSCHRRPTRTVCIHAETIPQSFYKALWWMHRDGEDVPVAFRAARLTGALHYGAETPADAAESAVNVVSVDSAAGESLVRRTVSLFLAGSRVRELRLNPAAVGGRLERLDVSNCRCLKSLLWTSTSDSNPQQQQLSCLRVLKASFSGLDTFPAETIGEWAPEVSTVLLSGCRALPEEQMNGMLEGCSVLRVARLDSTKLSCIDAVALHCPALLELNVSNCSLLSDLFALSELTCLRVLDLHSCANVVSLSGLERCRNLRRLDLSHCKRVSTLQPLDGALTRLEHFNASHCTGLRDGHLRSLGACAQLEEVKVNQCPALRDISALAGHTNLLVLEAADTGLTSVAALRSCTALQQLSVAGCAALKDIAVLRGLHSLATVDACYSGVTRVAELVDLCASLRVVLVRNCDLDEESTAKLEMCAARIASTHRAANSGNSSVNAATMAAA